MATRLGRALAWLGALLLLLLGVLTFGLVKGAKHQATKDAAANAQAEVDAAKVAQETYTDAAAAAQQVQQQAQQQPPPDPVKRDDLDNSF